MRSRTITTKQKLDQPEQATAMPIPATKPARNEPHSHHARLAKMS